MESLPWHEIVEREGFGGFCTFDQSRCGLAHLYLLFGDFGQFGLQTRRHRRFQTRRHLLLQHLTRLLVDRNADLRRRIPIATTSPTDQHREAERRRGSSKCAVLDALVGAFKEIFGVVDHALRVHRAQPEFIQHPTRKRKQE